MKLSLH
jgi:hypothetical protein